MIIYTLYVKVHRKTGLRYLGQTSQDPFKYPGSGTDWSLHLKQHGNDVETTILLQTSSKEERNQQGIHYSNLWKVVSAMDDFGNRIWANKIPETGAGCPTSPKSATHKQNIAKALTGKKKTAEHIANIKKNRPPKFKRIVVNGVEFPSVNSAAEHFGVSHCTISNRLAGRKKISKRFWEVRYANTQIPIIC